MTADVEKTDCKDYRDALGKRLDRLESRMNWFYILAIGSLLSFVMSLIKG